MQMYKTLAVIGMPIATDSTVHKKERKMSISEIPMMHNYFN